MLQIFTETKLKTHLEFIRRTLACEAVSGKQFQLEVLDFVFSGL